MELDASVFLSEDRIAGLFSVPNEIFEVHMLQSIPCEETNVCLLYLVEADK